MLLWLPEKIRRYRAGMVLLSLIGVLLVVFQAAQLSRDQATADLSAQAKSDLSRYHLNLQQKLNQFRDLPALLSSHSNIIESLAPPQATEQGKQASQLQANKYLAHVSTTMGTADIYVMDLTGTTVAASNWQEARSFVGKNYSFRPYFKSALQGTPGHYFALGTVSKKRGFYFSHPVYEAGQIVGVVVVKIDLNDIEKDWSDPEQFILVADEDGVVFISTREDWKFKTLKPLSNDDLKRIVASLRYGDHDLTALEMIETERLEGGSQLVTLVEGDVIRSSALDGVKTQEYLMHNKLMVSEGLNIIVLTSMQSVRQQMLNTVILTAFICVALVFLVLFLVERERIKRERERFKRQRTYALEENEARIRAIIDNTRAGLITLDAQGRIMSFNSTAERLFGYTKADVEKDYFSLLLSQEDRSVCWQHITTTEPSSKNELFIEARGRRADGGYFPIEFIIGQAYVGGVKHFVVTIHDIRERKEYEQKLHRAREELESRVRSRTHDLTQANAKLQAEVQQHTQTRNELIQTAKLAVLGQMSAGINHELNQPLAAIRAYADNAQAFLKLDRVDVAATNLKHISDLTERMAKIIHPLKVFARKSEDKLETLNLKTVFDGVMSVMYGRVSKERAKVNLPEGLAALSVEADMLRLEQVLINLITNALQAMADAPQKMVDVVAYAEGGQVFIQVRDHGTGIAESDIPHLFEPFFTTKEAGQGLGLGLSISQRIIENLNGQLSVANHPEGGACFTIVLPQGATSKSDKCND